MSRWADAAAVALVATALFAQTAAGSARGEALHLEGDAMTFPVTTLAGGVGVAPRRVTLPADVLFTTDSARLSPNADAAVAVAVSVIRERRPVSVRVVGYTDDRGTASYNLALSRRRAHAVQRALRRGLGPGAPPVRASGRGEADPVAANRADRADSLQGMARNRRVEVLLP